MKREKSNAEGTAHKEHGSAGGKDRDREPGSPRGGNVDASVTYESEGDVRSIMDILNSGPERRLFKTAEEVKAYLAEEKASWDR